MTNTRAGSNLLGSDTELEAVVFDFDGTLVDTMPLHYRAYRDVLHGYGISLTMERFLLVTGGKASETIPRMAGRALTPREVEQIHRAKKERVATLFATEEIVRLHTSIILRLLAGRLPLALASAGSRDGILLILNRLGWATFFNSIVTGEDVVHGKPAPDAFLLAAAQMNVRANACLVFEDTDAGIEAARRAGMACIDVRQPMALPVED